MMFKKLMMCSVAAIQLFFIEPVSATLEVDKDFYVGKIPGKESRGGKELWLVMERIRLGNLERWTTYLKREVENTQTRVFNARLSELRNGSWHALEVLEKCPNSALLDNRERGELYPDDEIWMAYVTKAETPKKKNFSNEDIEMFVTVTSSANALLTTHAGIARSVNATKNGGTRNISMYLHAFAAQVMLKRNPQRRYMITAPTPAMENIMVDAVPGGVFVGTREMHENLRKAVNTDYDKYVQEYGAKNLEQFDQACMKYLEETNLLLKQKYDERASGTITKSELDRITEEFSPYEYGFKNFVDLDAGTQKIVLSDAQKSAAFKSFIDEQFKPFKNPYYFSVYNAHLKGRVRAETSNPFYDFMEKNPPILSVGHEGRSESRCIADTFTIFDHKNPEQKLTVHEGDSGYGWLFLSHYKALEDTHYILVRLEDLANSKKVEPSHLTLKDVSN